MKKEEVGLMERGKCGLRGEAKLAGKKGGKLGGFLNIREKSGSYSMNKGIKKDIRHVLFLSFSTCFKNIKHFR